MRGVYEKKDEYHAGVLIRDSINKRESPKRFFLFTIFLIAI